MNQNINLRVGGTVEQVMLFTLVLASGRLCVSHTVPYFFLTFKISKMTNTEKGKGKPTKARKRASLTQREFTLLTRYRALTQTEQEHFTPEGYLMREHVNLMFNPQLQWLLKEAGWIANEHRDTDVRLFENIWTAIVFSRRWFEFTDEQRDDVYVFIQDLMRLVETCMALDAHGSFKKWDTYFSNK